MRTGSFRRLLDLHQQAMLSLERIEKALEARSIRYKVQRFGGQKNFYRVLVYERDLLIAKEIVVRFLAEQPVKSRAVH